MHGCIDTEDAQTYEKDMTESDIKSSNTTSTQELIYERGFRLTRREFVGVTAAVAAIAGLSALATKVPFQMEKVEAQTTTTSTAATEQVIPSVCRICSASDLNLVHVVNGQPTYIEGNPADQNSRGHMCARGLSGIWEHYDPYRVKAPLQRTNAKGMYQIGEFVEISWDDAYNAISSKLQSVRAKGPQGNVFFRIAGATAYGAGWWAAFYNVAPGKATQNPFRMNYCGHGGHNISIMSHNAFVTQPDYKYTNYLLEFGQSDGRQGLTFVPGANLMADARARGMHIVQLNPYMGAAAATADEWIPIVPHTDGAFASAMLEVMLIELKQYDTTFIKQMTNGPYLIGSDGLYVRDAATKKPLVWDPVDNTAKTYDDATIKDYALLGTLTVNGASVNPGFQMLVNAVTTLTPEWAEGITGVPAATIRRIATEWVNAAQIGSTITINGKTYPYRPVSTPWFGSAVANTEHTIANGIAVELINTVVGNVDVPGGHCSSAGSSTPFGGPDGMIGYANGDKVAATYKTFNPSFSWPPKDTSLFELFPFNQIDNPAPVLLTMANPTQYWGAGNKTLDFVMVHAYNPAISMYDGQKMDTVFKNASFYASISLWVNDTDNAFADIILPDRCYLEEYGILGGSFMQPATTPPYSIPYLHETLTTIASQAGFLQDYNTQLLNSLKAPNTFDVTQPADIETYMDLLCKSTWGANNGLSVMQKNGSTKAVSNIESYLPWRGLTPPRRIPLYFEQYLEGRNLLQKNLAANKIILTNGDGSAWNWEDYSPVPTWIPPVDVQDTSPYDLVLISYVHPYDLPSYGLPTLVDISLTTPDAYSVVIHADAAKARGISEGDTITVEGAIGKWNGIAHLSQGIHPSAIAVSRGASGWSSNSIIKDLYKNNKMVSFQTLRPDETQYIDKVAGALQDHVKVRVYKATTS
jgi:anaerobic selenocysteine-containing dehydrogenase